MCVNCWCINSDMKVTELAIRSRQQTSVYTSPSYPAQVVTLLVRKVSEYKDIMQIILRYFVRPDECRNYTVHQISPWLLCLECSQRRAPTSVVTPAWLPVSIYQRGSHWPKFHEILFATTTKICRKHQISFQQDKKSGTLREDLCSFMLLTALPSIS